MIFRKPLLGKVNRDCSTKRDVTGDAFKGKGGFMFDNRYVVPYNIYLLKEISMPFECTGLQYEGHIGKVSVQIH